MKKRRTVIAVSLVAALLCVGVGYAALNDKLVVTGNVSVGVNEFAPNVYFDSVLKPLYEVSSGVNTGVTAEIGAESADTGDARDKLTITVPNTVLVSKGDKVTVEAVITNQSNKYQARVTLNDTVSSTDGLYKVTCVWKDTGNSEPYTIGINGDIAHLAVTIELLQTPTTMVSNDKFTITYNAEAIDN